MTTIPPIAPDASQATDSRSRLSDNYDTFLTLLTAQLQNQDPLAPMDSTQFTQQLVQFSQVEQQIRTNEQLEGLVGQYQAASAGAALSYLGRDAIIENDETYLANGAANWAYDLDDTAASVKLEVRDAHGRTVFEAQGVRAEGEHLFSWDGATTNGTAPDGAYSLVVTALDADGEAIDHSITVREPILGVDFSGANPLVITPSGSRELDQIRTILDS